jgi:hypothetical protein
MRIFPLIATISLLSAALAACSVSDCAYYGSPSYNVRCVVGGPGPTGGGH